MLFDIPFIADWSKIGEYRQKQTDKNNNRKTKPDLTGTINPATKDCCKKMVYSAKQKVGVTGILGLSLQFIQMGQLEFNAERFNIRKVTQYFKSGT